MKTNLQSKIYHSQEIVACLHCGLPITKNILQKNKNINFCCSGCEHVYALIHDLGLNNFYNLKNTTIQPKQSSNLRHADLKKFEDYYHSNVGNLIFNIEGVECSACVWLIKKVALQYQLKVSVNTVLFTLQILNQEPELEHVKNFLNTIQSLGYSVSLDRQHKQHSHTTAIKMGVCLLLAINIMGLNFAIYLGLGEEDFFIFKFIKILIASLTTLSVLIGGSVFIQKSFQAIKNKVFHFDIPVSMGIVLSYFGSMVAFLFGYGEKTYFDSLAIFIALMLLGRFLQERWLEKNRASILDPVNFKELKVLRFHKDGVLESVRFNDIGESNLLLLRPGDIVPAMSEIVTNASDFEFDYQWISGESESIKKSYQDIILAGARYLGQNNIQIQCKEAFDHSRLSMMNNADQFQNCQDTEFLGGDFSKYYTIFVFVLLFLSFLINMVFFDFERALFSMVTISVVTCPCAVGITLPIMQFVLQQKLFNQGVLLQSKNVLSSISNVTAIVFDKTGTLTLLDKKVSPSQSYRDLSSENKSLLFSAVMQSKHPLSQKIFDFMVQDNLSLKAFKMTEKAGQGLFFMYESDSFYVGKSNATTKSSVVFMKNNLELCSFSFEEVLLNDSQRIILELKKTKKIFLLSGDKQKQVMNIAKKLKIHQNDVGFECLPEDKKKWVKNRLKNEKVLFLGDGLNDVEAMQASFLSGASLSQSIVASHISNFCFKPFSLTWMLEFFKIGNVWKRLLTFNYILAIIYNIVVASCAVIGWIGPLEAAIIMPAFSILVLFLSTQQIQKT